MERLVDQPPTLDRGHFIYTVGELVAAILDMDRRFAMRQEPAIDIGDA